MNKKRKKSMTTVMVRNVTMTKTTNGAPKKKTADATIRQTSATPYNAEEASQAAKDRIQADAAHRALELSLHKELYKSQRVRRLLNSSTDARLIGTYIPSLEHEARAVVMTEGEVLTSRAHDYALSILTMLDTSVEVPVIITRSKVENVLKEVIQTSAGAFSYDEWRNLLELTITKLADDSTWMPSATEIDALLVDHDEHERLPTVQGISRLFSEAYNRSYGRTIVSSLLKSNWMYHVQRHIHRSSELNHTLKYTALQELAELYSNLYIESSQVITPGQRSALLLKVTKLGDAETDLLTADGQSLLSGLMGLGYPVNMASTKSVTLPRRAAIEIVAELGLCKPPEVAVAMVEPEDTDTLLREVVYTPTVDTQILETINKIGYPQVVSFLLDKLNTRRLGLGIAPLKYIRSHIRLVMDEMAKGIPGLDMTVFRDDRIPTTDAEIIAWATHIAQTIWQTKVLDCLYHGLLGTANPLFMRLRIGNDDLIDMAPAAALVTSALKFAYDLFSEVNAEMLRITRYEALSASWHDEDKFLHNEWETYFLELVKKDQAEDAYIYSRLDRQIAFNKVSFFTPQASLGFPQHLVLDQVTVDDAEKGLTFFNESAMDVWNHSLLIRSDISGDRLLEQLGSLVADPRDRMIINILSMAGVYSEIHNVVFDKSFLPVTVPDVLLKIHNLLPFTSLKTTLLKKLRRYGISFELKSFETLEEVIRFLGDVTMSSQDYLDLGYDITKYVTPATAARPRMFLYVNSYPMLVRHLRVDGIPTIGADHELLQTERGSGLLAHPSSLAFIKIHAANEVGRYVIYPNEPLHLQSIKKGEFKTPKTVESSAKELIQPAVYSVVIDRTASAGPFGQARVHVIDNVESKKEIIANAEKLADSRRRLEEEAGGE